MNKFHILLLVLFSTFLLPNNTMACGRQSEKKSDTEASCSTKEELKSHCSETSESDNDSKGCSGACEQSCCSCSGISSSTAFALAPVAKFETKSVAYQKERESQFSYVSKSISDGFLSVWLIPKIG